MPETVIHPDTAQCLMLQGELEGGRIWLWYEIEVSYLIFKFNLGKSLNMQNSSRHQQTKEVMYRLRSVS